MTRKELVLYTCREEILSNAMIKDIKMEIIRFQLMSVKVKSDIMHNILY